MTCMAELAVAEPLFMARYGPLTRSNQSAGWRSPDWPKFRSGRRRLLSPYASSLPLSIVSIIPPLHSTTRALVLCERVNIPSTNHRLLFVECCSDITWSQGA